MARFRDVREAAANEQSWIAASEVSAARGTPAGRNTLDVLLISNDPGETRAFEWAMRALDWKCARTSDAFEGLAMAGRARFDLILVDAALANMSGIDVVRALQAEDENTRVIVIGAFPISMGAQESVSGVLQKLFNASDVIATINSTLRRSGAMGIARPGDDHDSSLTQERTLADYQLSQSAPGSVTERWADFVLRTIDARVDPKTVIMWAKSCAVSRSVLCECCRLVHVKAHDARDFSRLMRAICHSGDEWQPEAVLDLADGRTLNKLLARAGLSSRTTQTPTVPEFLRRQRWIPQDNPGLMVLKDHLLCVPNASHDAGVVTRFLAQVRADQE